jgi:hypothetical protein
MSLLKEAESAANGLLPVLGQIRAKRPQNAFFGEADG